MNVNPSPSKVWQLVLAFVLVTAVWPSTVRAAIATFTGEVIEPPPSVEEEALTSQDRMFAFVERRDYVLPAPIDVDWDASVALDSIIADGLGFFPGTIPAGTRVDSILIHYDTPGQQLGLIAENLVIDAPILGVIASSANLDASDPFLGAPGTSYPSPGVNFRGTASETLEFDDILIFDDLIQINSTVENVFDQLRILTVPGPMPGDANGDGRVDILDLDILSANFGQLGAGYGGGDFNHDGLVDILDLDILSGNFGADAGMGGAMAAAVPEASAFLIAGAVFSVLVASRRTIASVAGANTAG